MAMLPVVLPVRRWLPQKSMLLHLLHFQASSVTMRKRGKWKLVLTLRVIVLRRFRVEAAIKQDQDQQRSKGKLHLHRCLSLRGLPFLIPVHPNLVYLVLFQPVPLLRYLHRVNNELVRRLHLAPLHRIWSRLKKRVIPQVLRRRKTRYATIQRI